MTHECITEADDYASNAHPSATTRVLLLSRVVLGKQFTTKLNSSHLLEPPEGYHSVRGFQVIRVAYLLSWKGPGSSRRSSELRRSRCLQ